MTISRRAAADLAAAALLAGATFLLYHRVLGLFWIYDTPFHLRLLSQHGALDFLFSRAPWSQEKNIFTPLLFLSLDLDRALGGSPALAYAHQLAAIAGCALALYGALRLWVAAWPALAGALLFVAGPSVAASAPVLMVRHYFEALALAAVALATFVVAVRRDRARWSVVSALFFLGALLCKEIAAPVVVLAALVPEGDWRRRLRHLAFHGTALAVYAAWRIALLEHPLAGHGWIDRRGLIAATLALPAELGAALFGAPLAAAVLLALAVAAGLVFASRSSAAAILVTLAASLATIAPVAFEVEARFVLAPWLLLAAGAACGWSAIGQRSSGSRLAPWLAAASVAAAAFAARHGWRAELERAQRMSTEARAFIALPAGAALRHPAVATSTLQELRRLATSPEVRWYQDDLYLCVEPRPSSIVAYEAQTGRVADVSVATLQGAAETCATRDEASPLEARFDWTADGLLWELGPYPDGEYSFVVEDGVSRIAVPRRGGYSWQAPALELRVRHQAPGGRVTYSPALSLDRSRGGLAWRRPE